MYIKVFKLLTLFCAVFSVIMTTNGSNFSENNLINTKKQNQVAELKYRSILPHQVVTQEQIDDVLLEKVLHLCGVLTLEELKHKEELNFGWKNLGCEDCIDILEVLKFKWYSKVKKLSFASNNLGNNGAKALADCVRKGGIPYIQILDLRLNSIGDDGIFSIVNAIWENIDNLKYLKEVWLDKNKFETDWLKMVKSIFATRGINISY